MKRSDFNFAHSAQSVINNTIVADNGSACGSGDKPAEKPAACGSACGSGDKPAEKPAACGSACGSGDK